MHKYWGKKPSNDLKNLIEKYTVEGDTVLDPFSGYGVFCCEAFLLNRNVISNDLNPVANFLNNQLLEQDIDLKKLQNEWNLIKDQFEPYNSKWFSWNYEGTEVELISILRNTEDIPIRAKFKNKNEKKAKEISLNEDEVKKFLRFENSYTISDWFPVTPLIENSRISAKPDMAVPDLFTKRTLACHARLFSLINELSSGNEQMLLKVAFTANVANCSRLVPPIKSRGPMAPGAWMTGFYTGDTYLENNVLNYFKNRIDKIIKGKIEYLSYFKSNLLHYSNTYRVTNNDAKNLDIQANSIDYVFTDPPYGDAVPYFEQSIIWNSWLNFTPDYQNEIVITDSKTRKKGNNQFENDIYLAFEEIRRVLKPEGYFSLTYHSLSGLEWKAITNACLRNGFDLVDFEWLVQKSFTPRQINRAKSVKGDVLITLQKAPSCRVIHKSTSDLETFFENAISEWLEVQPLDTNEIFLRSMKLIFTNKYLIADFNLFSFLCKTFEISNDNKWILKSTIETTAV